MNKDLPLIVAGIIFSIVAIVHLTRLFLKFGLIIAGYPVPLSFNGVGFVIAAILAIWMFKASRR